MFALLLSVALSTPVIGWPQFFAKVSAQGLTYSQTLRHLEGHRVRLRGYSVAWPEIEHGVLLTSTPYGDPHEVEETDVPFDAVAVVWRSGLALPPTPRRPTVEGTLRLGNRNAGPVIVAITLEDAVPAPPPDGAEP